MRPGRDARLDELQFPLWNFRGLVGTSFLSSHLCYETYTRVFVAVK
jgi:hypothetical protein